jgi:hypothetical protein
MPKHVGVENWNVLIKIHCFLEHMLVFLQTKLSVIFSKVKKSLPLKTVPVGCPETSIRNYIFTMDNIPEEGVFLHFTTEVWNLPWQIFLQVLSPVFQFQMNEVSKAVKLDTQGDQNVSVHLMVTVQKHTKKDGHHRIHSECGPCYTEHGLREYSSACQ